MVTWINGVGCAQKEKDSSSPHPDPAAQGAALMQQGAALVAEARGQAFALDLGCSS